MLNPKKPGHPLGQVALFVLGWDEVTPAPGAAGPALDNPKIQVGWGIPGSRALPPPTQTLPQDKHTLLSPVCDTGLDGCSCAACEVAVSCF